MSRTSTGRASRGPRSRPTYKTGNQVGNLNQVYDTNGNVKQNSLSMNFSWNAVRQPITVNGVGGMYDALGRLVETNNGGS